MTLQQRFTMEIRFAREMGWIEVRDPFYGYWHEVRLKDAPEGWVRAAFAAKQRRTDVSRNPISAGVSHPPSHERPREEAYAF